MQMDPSEMLCGLTHWNKELWKPVRQVTEVTLWRDSERQTVKANFLLLRSEHQQERRYLSSTLLILPSQMQPRCSLVRRTRHASTTCLVEESGSSHQQHGFAGEVLKCEDSRQSATQGSGWSGRKAWPPGHPVNTMFFQTHQRALACFGERSTANSKAAIVLLASISDVGTLWDQTDRQTGLPIVSSSNYVLAKPTLQQLAWNNGAATGLLRARSQPVRNNMILMHRHHYSYSSPVNSVLPEMNCGLFLRKSFFPACILN